MYQAKQSAEGTTEKCSINILKPFHKGIAPKAGVCPLPRGKAFFRPPPIPECGCIEPHISNTRLKKKNARGIKTKRCSRQQTKGQSAKRMPIGIGQRLSGKMPISIRQWQPERKKDAVRHQTMVASHTETPLGVSKWLVWDCSQ